MNATPASIVGLLCIMNEWRHPFGGRSSPILTKTIARFWPLITSFLAAIFLNTFFIRICYVALLLRLVKQNFKITFHKHAVNGLKQKIAQTIFFQFRIACQVR